MTTKQATGKQAKEISKFGRWMLHTMNKRAGKKLRSGHAKVMGTEALILHTVGKHSGRPRETPLHRFADGAGGWFVVASGGQGGRYPDWHANLLADPDRATIELPGQPVIPVSVRRLEGAEREQVWREIVRGQPRLEKYQSKTTRPYPVIQLTPRSPDDNGAAPRH